MVICIEKMQLCVCVCLRERHLQCSKMSIDRCWSGTCIGKCHYLFVCVCVCVCETFKVCKQGRTELGCCNNLMYSEICIIAYIEGVKSCRCMGRLF